MGKRVDFTRTAAFWLLEKDLVTDDVIVANVLDFPVSKRISLEDDCYFIEFRRRKRWITVWVREYSERLLVYKLHSSSKPTKRPLL
jgi:hypothetical protein